jgi:hypothetical protein
MDGLAGRAALTLIALQPGNALDATLARRSSLGRRQCGKSVGQPRPYLLLDVAVQRLLQIDANEPRNDLGVGRRARGPWIASPAGPGGPMTDPSGSTTPDGRKACNTPSLT